MRQLYLAIAVSIFLGCQDGTRNEGATNDQVADFQPTTEAAEQPEELASLADLKRTYFFRDFKLTPDRDWTLGDGRHNHAFRSKMVSDVTIETVVRGEKIEEFGLTFYDRDLLSGDDLSFVFDLLKSLNEVPLKPEHTRFIAENSNKKISQIKLASPIRFGSFQIYVGKVGDEQVISIKKEAV